MSQTSASPWKYLPGCFFIDFLFFIFFIFLLKVMLHILFFLSDAKALYFLSVFLQGISTPSTWAFGVVRVLRRSTGATTGGWCMSLQMWACCIYWPPFWRVLHNWCCSCASLYRHISSRLCKVTHSLTSTHKHTCFSMFVRLTLCLILIVTITTKDLSPTLFHPVAKMESFYYLVYGFI